MSMGLGIIIIKKQTCPADEVGFGSKIKKGTRYTNFCFFS